MRGMSTGRSPLGQRRVERISNETYYKALDEVIHELAMDEFADEATSDLVSCKWYAILAMWHVPTYPSTRQNPIPRASPQRVTYRMHCTTPRAVCMLCRYLSKLCVYKVAGTDKFSPSTLEHMIETWKGKQVSLEHLISKCLVPHYVAKGDFERPGSCVGAASASPVAVACSLEGESDVLKREGRMI